MTEPQAMLASDKKNIIYVIKHDMRIPDYLIVMNSDILCNHKLFTINLLVPLFSDTLTRHCD